ncbi:MAG TPA: hypothetical protein VMU51_32880 [Mycobacteriales bacterium]|nr:hypothetical protein [Mycobacteriales bacterium]
MTVWLLRQPQWLALVLVVGGLAGLSIVAFRMVHVRWPAARRRRHNDVAGFIFAVAGAMYGVLLGFVVVVLWGQYSDALADTDREAAVALAVQHELVSTAGRSAGDDEAARQEALLALHAYVRSVVDVEFPQLAAGGLPADSTPVLGALWTATAPAVDAGANAGGTLARARDLLDELVEARSTRLSAARNTLPATVWLAIALGGVLTIGFGCLFGAESALVQGVMVAALAGLIGIMVYLTVELDHPFAGRVRATPAGFEQILTWPNR